MRMVDLCAYCRLVCVWSTCVRMVGLCAYGGTLKVRVCMTGLYTSGGPVCVWSACVRMAGLSTYACVRTGLCTYCRLHSSIHPPEMEINRPKTTCD